MCSDSNRTNFRLGICTNLVLIQNVSALAFQVLHLSATMRTLNNMPTELERLERLVDLDLSFNKLGQIPDSIFQV